MFVQIFQRAMGFIANALTYDFFPQAHPILNGLKQPVGWVVCAIAASLLVGLFVGPQGFVLAGAFVALLIFGVLWPWLCMKNLNCQLKFHQSRSVEGEPTYVVLEVTNRLPIPAFGLMIQGKLLQDVIHQDDVTAVALKQVPGWSVSNFNWPLVPGRRGVLPTETPSLVTGFPFGLYQMSKPVQVTGGTTVWPKTEEFQSLAKTIGGQFAMNATADRQSGNDGETIGVRDYRYGDSVRNIHWSHTARHNRLILRERQSRTQTRMRVVVDLTSDHHRGTGSQSTHEKAIRLAASVCRELHRHQFQIDLVCLGLAVGVPFQSNNHGGIKEMLDFLSRLPESNDRSMLATSDRRTVETAIRSNRTFTFLIHTEKFTPDVDASRVCCVCVDFKPDVEMEITSNTGTAEPPDAPSNRFAVAPAKPELGVLHVPA